MSEGVSTVRTPVLKDGPLDASDDGRVTSRNEFDRKGRVTFTIEDDGDVFESQYDGADRVIARIDPEGNRADYTYDENNNMTKVVETEVTQEGNSPSLTEKFTTINAYDALDRLVRITDNIGQTSRFSYDSRNNLISTSDPNGKKTKDKEGLYDGKINKDGNTVHYYYDGINRKIKEERDLRKGGLGNGAIDTTNSYNTDGKITITYTYDGNSRLTAITDDNGNTTQYNYDDSNRLTKQTNADGMTKTFEYDKDSNLLKATDENGSVTEFTYDAINRLVQKDITRASGVIGTTQQTFEYDGLSRLTKSFDNNDPDDTSDNATVTYAYDSLGRLLEEAQNGKAVSSQWDGSNNRLALIYPNDREIETSYDKIDRIDTIKDSGSATNIVDYDYIGPGRVLERTYSNGIRMTFLNDDRTKDIGYDKARRPVKLRHLTESNELIAGFEHGYDRTGNKLYETRLHEFNGKKNVGDVYAYDFANRLCTVSRKTDSAIMAAYTYDASGRRIRKVISNSGNLDGTTNFYLDRWREIEERDDSDSVLQQYVYGMYIDEPLVLNRNMDGDDSAISIGDEQLFYHQNTLYSIFALTDNDGKVVEGYQYDAYGRQTVFSPGDNDIVDFGGDDVVTDGSTNYIGNSYLFTGRRLDTETDLYYYRMRYMHASQGRFVSKDPAGVWYDKENSGNGYTYVNNSPVNWIDSTGLIKRHLLFYHKELSFFTAFTAVVFSMGDSFSSATDILNKVSAILRRPIDREGNCMDCLRHIEIVAHGGSGYMDLGGSGADFAYVDPQKDTISFSNQGVQSLFVSLSQYLCRPSFIVLNMCSVGKDRRGDILLQSIADITGAIVTGPIEEVTDIPLSRARVGTRTRYPTSTCTVPHRSSQSFGRYRPDIGDPY